MSFVPGRFGGICYVRPVYRDPVHDFGILKFDPNAIKYKRITKLKLNPDGAQVGVEIRVVGNDAGEKLSILSGVISLLDRNAPEYGAGYNDFNTNYIQAAAAASGGSSGSPVVNVFGDVVALQAGARVDGAATDFFLPLSRPLRALQCIQEGKPVTRGTIQTQWMIKPFDECRRLGLTPDCEAYIRKIAPKETGMLVAKIVLPEGPADGKLQEGDVLLKVNGELLTQFVRLDDILDSNVGQSIRILIQRGGEDLEVDCTVGDLHAITPDRFVSVAGATFHDLSYQQARLYAIACRGVYVCEAAGSFKIDDNTPSGWIIDSVGRQPTRNLQEFIQVMKTIPDRSKIVISCRHIRYLHMTVTKVIDLDRHWHPMMSLAVRDDETGVWNFSVIANPIPAELPAPQKANFTQLDGNGQTAPAEIVRSFVHVSCTMPLKLDGFPKTKTTGCGLVIDADKGLVFVSRAIVPHDLCDIDITVAESIIVTGKVVFMHPLQNYAILRYDPSLVLAPVRSARLSTENIKQGQETIFVGFDSELRIAIAKTTVTQITTVIIPVDASAPRYRSINTEAIMVDTKLSDECTNGVLLGKDGIVQALWLNFLGADDSEYPFGLATPSFLPVISKIQQGVIPTLRILNMESCVIKMSDARARGVSNKRIDEVAKANPSRQELLIVWNLGRPPLLFAHKDDALRVGDVILTLNERLITGVLDLDIMYDNEVLDAVIVRDKREMHVKVHTVPTEDIETDRAVVFCGAVLQKPHLAVRQQISELRSEIYVSARSRGSPAHQYELSPTNFITAVNLVPTGDLDSFVREVKKIPDNTYFRLQGLTFDNTPWIITMKKSDRYFAMLEYVKDTSSLPASWKVIADEASMTQGNITADAMDVERDDC
ncbi:PDZ domain-containing protein C23G3.12C, putative [Talaromyces stipitatus ATCC 10500]|uniref:Pro-apoptotic serine protease NMA111 n=1 Tax=Talaromyces stipitatus (strain ATCC 10500 / CBS 375.48 / QM 6759 / NRRL 1006) TaxID=441959 RepID=B8MUN1_TALSN|nr:PDZ domain-containing protein C23G3.12C, putative [Talaromyces stipitatus ATCC 10500]EED11699.1 PDZ domain-containing protein C23G3.12C, putative [Talaromyces stipitatus ATCC 10500]